MPRRFGFSRNCAVLASYLLMCGLLLSGCNAHRLRLEHSQLRGQVLALYEEQILDNLVRAHDSDVLVHLNYSNFEGQSQTFLELFAQVGDGDNDNLGTAPTLAGQIVELDTENIFGNAKLHGSNNLKLVAQPVPLESATHVYRSYREFARNASLFGCGSRDRRDEAARAEAKRIVDDLYAHGEANGQPLSEGDRTRLMNDSLRDALFKTRTRTRRIPGTLEFAKTFCWIPASAKDQFYQLVLDTTLVQRGLPPKEKAVQTTTTSETITSRSNGTLVKKRASTTVEKKVSVEE